MAATTTKRRNPVRHHWGPLIGAALADIEVPEAPLAPNGAALSKGEWLVLEALRYCRLMGVANPSVKQLAHVLGWWLYPRPFGVIERLRRLEAKGVLVTTERRGPEDEPMTDHYDIVGEV